MTKSVLHSPYDGVDSSDWTEITQKLIDKHPLETTELVEVVLQSWEAIFATSIAVAGFRIGRDLHPQPQIMAFFLHELIPLELERRYPQIWKRQQKKNDKDLVHVPDPKYSVEIKCSSHKSEVFGNRSYGQPTKKEEVGRKGKAGYFLTINFDKFLANREPLVRVIRFGWLDHHDWVPQRAESGQSARLRSEAYRHKLRILYPTSD